MKKYTYLIFLVLIANFLISEENKEYCKDEWENDYNTQEKELFNIVKIQVETQDEKDDELSNQHNKNEYFTKMYIEGAFNWAKSNQYGGKINSYILATYYEVFLSFGFSSKKSLALRFSPILMYYPKKQTSPVLSLYLGNFNTPRSFSNIYNPLISSITTTSNRKFFPPLNAIKISKKTRNEGIAVEVSLPFFNYYAFWKNTRKGNIFNTYISYKNKFSNSTFINIALSSSIQEIKKENLNQNPYLQIYGVDFNFSHRFFYINCLSALTVLPKRIPSFHSFAFKTEGGLLSKFVSLHSGISYKGAYYLGDQNLKTLLQRKTFLSFYLQGKIKYKIFSLNCMYHFLKDYKISKIQHSYGVFYSLGNKTISYKNEVFYKNNIYKIKFGLNIIPNLSYFQPFNFSSFLYLQDKKINPSCIKKYEMASKCGFNIGNNFALNFAFVMMQEKTNWKKIMLFASTAVTFSFAQEKTKEKGEIKLKYNSKKRDIELSLKFRFEY